MSRRAVGEAGKDNLVSTWEDMGSRKASRAVEGTGMAKDDGAKAEEGLFAVVSKR